MLRTQTDPDAAAAAPSDPATPTPASAPRAGVRCRRIAPADLGALSDLLTRGFPALGPDAWARALERARAWHETHGLPGFGFVLEDGEALVGVLLTLYAPDGRRCNLSSWYVESGYRRFGTMLVSAALRDRSVTYVNISPERHTWPIIEAQGFRRYADGTMIALPLLALGGAGARVAVCEPPAGAALDPADRALMERHAAMGCLALWCVADGRAHPVVLARRSIRGIPMAQVIYCPPDFAWRRFAPAIGRALARRGLFLLALDAAGPVPGLPGRFLAGRMPKYARGPAAPRLADLSYTEAALIGT